MTSLTLPTDGQHGKFIPCNSSHCADRATCVVRTGDML